MTRRAGRTVGLCAVVACMMTSLPGIQGRAAATTSRPVPHRASGPGHVPGHVPGEVLVRFRAGTRPQDQATINRAVGTTVRHHLLLPRTLLVDVHGHQTVQGVIGRYERHRSVLYAEPNSIAEIAAVPNDPFFGKQWALRNVGQKVNGTTGTAGSDTDVVPAWDTTTGSSSVTVGIADTGVDIADPDLAGNTWTNPGEIPANGVDDDNNGKIDDVNGWNFVGRSNAVADDVWHGTFIAGVIGGVGNDGYGVTGVDWRVGLASLKACSLVAVTKNVPPALCTAADQADAFTYAGLMRMPVVNASFNAASYSKTVFNAIASAPDTLFVTVPGNAKKNVDTAKQYPCDYALTNIICVAATDQNDQLASFSSFGPTTVDLAAPGVNIYSTYPFERRFFDNLTTSITGRWTTGGTGTTWARVCTTTTACVLTDSPAGNYENNEDTWVQTVQPVDLGPWTACQVQYTLKGTVLAGDDLVVSASGDGVTWSPLAQWTGTVSNSPLATYNMNGFDGDRSVFLRFELVSDGTSTADGVSLDNIAIVCQPAPGTYAGSSAEYAFKNGTSFAAAYVSGAAALLKAARPSATMAQIRDALLNGVDHLPSLSGKVVTGGRLDVAGSLAAMG